MNDEPKGLFATSSDKPADPDELRKAIQAQIDNPPSYTRAPMILPRRLYDLIKASRENLPRLGSG
jgi:hypothetical protein